MNSVDPDGRENTKVVAGGDGLVINGVGYSTAVVNEGYGPNSIRADYHPAAVNTEWANTAIDVTWTAWSSALGVVSAGATAGMSAEGSLALFNTAADAIEQTLNVTDILVNSTSAADLKQNMINYASGEAVGRIWRAGQGVGGDASTTGNLILENHG